MNFQVVRMMLVLPLALLVFGCDGFVGEVSVSETSATQGDSTSRSRVSETEPSPIPSFDPRQITARFDDTDETVMVNPGMDYRFYLALSNNSERVVTAIRGVVSVRSANGSDLLLNHPFAATDLSLSPRQTARLLVELPLASGIASRSVLRFEVVAAEAR